MRKVRCRYCGSPTAQLRHEALVTIEDNGYRLFDVDPVPAATCAVMAITRNRAGELVWANTAPNATQVFPMHRCPQYLEEQALTDPCRNVVADVESWLLRRTPPSSPTPTPSRQRVTA